MDGNFIRAQKPTLHGFEVIFVNYYYQGLGALYNEIRIKKAAKGFGRKIRIYQSCSSLYLAFTSQENLRGQTDKPKRF